MDRIFKQRIQGRSWQHMAFTISISLSYLPSKDFKIFNLYVSWIIMYNTHSDIINSLASIMKLLILLDADFKQIFMWPCSITEVNNEVDLQLVHQSFVLQILADFLNDGIKIMLDNYLASIQQNLIIKW